MTDATQGAVAHAQTQESLEEMARFGISRVPADWCRFRSFRYTNLKDAIAEAKRQRARDLVECD